MLRIGVLGAGHLGKIHLRLLKEIEGLELVGFFDPDPEKAASASTEFDLKAFNSMESLLDSVDAVDIVTPTLSHFECAEMALRRFRHLFIEKPLTNELSEARQLLALVEEANVKVQVGHVERFNPAFLAIGEMDLNPMFIESHRLAMFNPRGTDVSVILDLMIHDIDLILSIVNANVKKVSASGVPIISGQPDIANARIEFDNGCVANLTASRFSLKSMRKMRLFQRDAYITVDFAEKKTEILTLSDAEKGNQPFIEVNTGGVFQKRYINFDQPVIPDVNAIKMELELFRDSILADTEPPVTIVDGYNAMNVAHMVMDRINKMVT